MVYGEGDATSICVELSPQLAKAEIRERVVNSMAFILISYLKLRFADGNMLRIKCEEVEAALRTTEQSLTKLHRLLDNKPIEYVAMALSGEMQAYCDIEDNMVKGMFGTIVQGYLKKGYNRATAEMMAREFF